MNMTDIWTCTLPPGEKEKEGGGRERGRERERETLDWPLTSDKMGQAKHLLQWAY